MFTIKQKEHSDVTKTINHETHFRKGCKFFYALNLFTKVARRNLILRRFFTSCRSFAEQKYSLTKRKMYYNVTKYCCNKIQLPVFVF